MNTASARLHNDGTDNEEADGSDDVSGGEEYSDVPDARDDFEDEENDYFDEVEPNGGTLLVFKRSDNSWHGHHSFEGARRAIQINWVSDEKVVEREQGRHGFSSKLKKFFKNKYP